MPSDLPQNPAQQLVGVLSERIVVIDGAMGTMLQRHDLQEADFRGSRFAEHSKSLLGCNDMLCLTQADIVEQIHCDYLQAGADIVETNSFNATSIALEDYALEGLAFEINKTAAEIARRAVAKVKAGGVSRPLFVAGSIGPTNRSASMSPDVGDPGARSVTFQGLRTAYAEQARGLVEGGADVLLVETIFDTLNAKAALAAIDDVRDDTGSDIPVILSVTIADKSGRTLSGQTLEAFWTSVKYTRPLAVSINCAMGPEAMRPYVEELSAVADVFTGCVPNAGLPNELGAYDETPASVASALRDFSDHGWLNIVGGCCGTTPAHITAIRDAVDGIARRVPPANDGLPRFSGLETLTIRETSNFIMVGERTNVSGSRRFARLIRERSFDEAISVARQQVEGGANILDVSMDEAMLDGVEAMRTFLNRLAAEPDIARIPLMIDSSDLDVIEAGLECAQGRCIVNSISLKEGEAGLIAQAKRVVRHGAAAVVMAFDEEGQAATAERKVEILSRAFDILTGPDVGMLAQDIIFDPNVLAVATGMAEHDKYAVDFIEAVRELKVRCPGALISGGISNLSFALRGNEVVRSAMNASFLYHAIAAGLDMGIVNAQHLTLYSDIPADLLILIEDVILARRADATERLVEHAQSVSSTRVKDERGQAWRDAPVDERLHYALVRGVNEHIVADTDESRELHGDALAVIEGPLMAAMDEVGRRFGEGEMFLPQVVKTARVMKDAVANLRPYIEAGKGAGTSRGRILLATVKGDVHDIGKNIVSVVLGCNGYDIVDLGVMVPAERILDEARKQQVDMIGISGLISPSLAQMEHVASEMQRQGFQLPLLIGGATTSPKHTAVKIAPKYEGLAIHVRDASKAVTVTKSILGREGAGFVEETKASQEAVRRDYEESQGRAGGRPLLSLDEARARRLRIEWQQEDVAQPEHGKAVLQREVPLDTIVPYIDWTPLFHAWELKGVYPSIFDKPGVGDTARELHEHATALLDEIVRERSIRAHAVYRFFPAATQERSGAAPDEVTIYEDESRQAIAARLHTLRQQAPLKDKPALALADFVAPVESGLNDWLGAFVVTAGDGVDALVKRYEAQNDDYRAIMVRALADRLAEALTEKVHHEARQLCGFGAAEGLIHAEMLKEKYRGIRPAPGYPACPDHTDKLHIFRLLDASETIGVELTESLAMTPAASVSGWIFNHPLARYFSVGRIDSSQVVERAECMGTSVEDVERWLGPNLL